MERKTAADFDPEILVLFDAYVHGAIDRRGFLDKARKYAVGGMSAAMMLDALNPKFAEAQQVPPDDKRLKIEDFSDPEKLGKFLTRFTSMWEMSNPTQTQQSLASVLFSQPTEFGISMDLLLTMQKMKL